MSKFEINESFTNKPMQDANQRLDLLRKVGLFSKYVWMLIASGILWFGLASLGISLETRPVLVWILVAFFAWIIAMIGEMRRVDRPYNPLRSIFYLLVLAITLYCGLRGVFNLFDTSIPRYAISAILMCSAAIAPLFYLFIHQHLDQRLTPMRQRGLTRAEIGYAVFFAILLGSDFTGFSVDLTTHRQALAGGGQKETSIITAMTVFPLALMILGWLVIRKNYRKGD